MGEEPPEAPPRKTARAGGEEPEAGDTITAIEAPLLAYAEAREAGTLPLPNRWEQQRQALQGLQHAMALDPGRGAAFVSIHHKYDPGDGRKPSFPGVAHTSLKDAASYAIWLASESNDVYWSMGAQVKHGEYKAGKRYPKALRQSWNVALLRCLFIDMDVKPEAYPSTREAAEALLGFVRAWGITPTMIVASGTGGLHVYWRLGEAVTPAQFARMAEPLVKALQSHGLKFDAACTVDNARLLRVPGTWNFKGLNPGELGRPVTLICAR
jgi:hypothetical protein